MIKSLRESKARLSELVRKASDGEEVIITVNGRPTAKLGPVNEIYQETSSDDWVQELKEAQATYTIQTVSSDESWENLREDRSS